MTAHDKLMATMSQLQLQAEEARSMYRRALHEIQDLEQQLQKQTRPGIPYEVAQAIYERGMRYGAEQVLDDLTGSAEVEVSEWCGNLHLTGTLELDLTEHLELPDLDYLESDIETMRRSLEGLFEELGFTGYILEIDRA